MTILRKMLSLDMAKNIALAAEKKPLKIIFALSLASTTIAVILNISNAWMIQVTEVFEFLNLKQKQARAWRFRRKP